ncbi:MAG TPA: hypothetical protein VMZ27_12675 [Candidatus Saccharimonadales bacterium]|nr:hypothetical protein [Candidatus Saccharimonadales bacterium]
MNSRFTLLFLCFCLLVTRTSARAAEKASPPRIDVILWFDTEDYLLPASDDAAKRVADMLRERGIRATFKIVGEKARTLERRGRKDVIAALKKHCVAFHSNFHSVHPTPSEYLKDAGFLDGVAEFVRREGPGAADVRRILGVKTLACYGQPGSSWAAQAVAGLDQIGVAPSGVACYVDEGDHVGLNNKPFWYANALNVYHMGQNYTRMDLHDPLAVEPAKHKVSAIASRLARQDGGGLISIFYHPCEWVHQEFWDGVNFARGNNPPRSEWKAPAQRTSEETEGAFKRFGEYVDHIRKIPGVRFITAEELPGIYPDRIRTEGANPEELSEIAKAITASGNNTLDFITRGNKSFSVADQFELLVEALAQDPTTQKKKTLSCHGLFGPDAACPSASQSREISMPAFRQAVTDARQFVHTQGRVPSRVFIGPDPVAPGDFLAAMAAVYLTSAETQSSVTLPVGRTLLPARQIAEDTPKLFGGWITHRENFQAPRLLEIARLQAWSLKPALKK